MTQNQQSAGTGTSVTSACITQQSKTMILVEGTGTKGGAYVLTTSSQTINEIAVGSSFDLKFKEFAGIPVLSLDLVSEGETGLSASSSGWTSSATNQYSCDTGGSVEVRFNDTSSEIIIVGTVPTDPPPPHN